jgi:hypothetical protein
MKLTPQEIRIVIFLLLALVVGSAVKHYRHRAPLPVPAQPAK